MRNHCSFAERSRRLAPAELGSAGGGKGNGVSRSYAVEKAHLLAKPEGSLFLNLDKRESSDPLRDYLAQHANLDGAKGNKAWGKVRTVRENFSKWFVDQANEHNTSHKERIMNRNIRRGFTVLKTDKDQTGFVEEIWRDGLKEAEAYFEMTAVRKGGKTVGHQIPKRDVDEFIRWKREVRRRKVGIKDIRPLTPRDVFPENVKKKNPESTGSSDADRAVSLSD